jgi:DNA-binding transcriptional ArsR family regulator
LPASGNDGVSVDDVMRALADGTRRKILRLVWSDERPSGEIAAHFALTRQAVSQHLGVMLDCQLVSVRPDGTKRMYRANQRQVEKLRREFDQFWDESLDRLKTVAERLEQRTREHGG